MLHGTIDNENVPPLCKGGLQGGEPADLPQAHPYAPAARRRAISLSSSFTAPLHFPILQLQTYGNTVPQRNECSEKLR